MRKLKRIFLIIFSVLLVCGILQQLYYRVKYEDVYKRQKECNGQKILRDNVDFNAVVDSKRQYPDMMVLDTEYLNADNSRLLKVYNFGADVVPGTATEVEIADLNTLKLQFARTPVGNTGKIRELLSKVSAMNIVRNSDGTVSGNVRCV